MAIQWLSDNSFGQEEACYIFSSWFYKTNNLHILGVYRLVFTHVYFLLFHLGAGGAGLNEVGSPSCCG